MIGLVQPSAPVIAPEPWTERASCAQVGPGAWDTFGGQLSDANRQALAICGGCPVREMCMEFALRMEPIKATAADRQGIYGGRTPAQRAAIALKRRRAEAKKRKEEAA